MSMSWSPSRTYAQVDEIICAEGSTLEVETCLVAGQIQRVYKNLWPSIRTFFLWCTNEHSNQTYIVFENRRLTFREISDLVAKCAGIFYDVYGIRKGDRVTICCRNYPQFVVSFWACHLIGAVSALVNAWLPLEPLKHCILKTGCKLVILDPERADKLESIISKLTSEAPTMRFAVIESHEGKGHWEGMDIWEEVQHSYQGNLSALHEDPGIVPEDNAMIIFTSGTTGFPKGVLSTQRMFLTVLLNSLANSQRAILRRGDEIIPEPPSDPQKGMLLPTPLFHITGTCLAALTCMYGLKMVLMRKWVPGDAARLIQTENVTGVASVPSLIHDLVNSTKVDFSLEALMYGGGPIHDSFTKEAKSAFPNAVVSQVYGLTESNASVVGFSGEDCLARPKSCGYPLPINDILVMDTVRNVRLPPGGVGEVWVRGPNVMKGYWNDTEATDRVLTKDGWLKTGDIGYQDDEGFLYIKDRQKDIIIRGGENVDSVAVENALYADPAILEAAAVGVPDKRLGEVVAAVVIIKPAFKGKVSEKSLIETASKSLPKFAIPVMVVIQEGAFEHTPSGKIIKADLRKLANDEWLRRSLKSKL